MQFEDTLEKRRRELMARCNEQRSSIALQVMQWKHSLSPDELTHMALYKLKQYQPWIIGTAVAVFVLKPRRVATLVKMATTTAQTVRTMAPLIQNVQRRVWLAKHPGHVQM